jgi:hypothetical protein
VLLAYVKPGRLTDAMHGRLNQCDSQNTRERCPSLTDFIILEAMFCTISLAFPALVSLYITPEGEHP